MFKPFAIALLLCGCVVWMIGTATDMPEVAASGVLFFLFVIGLMLLRKVARWLLR